MSNLYIVETLKGSRIHRANCKRKADTAVPLTRQVAEFAPGTLAKAKAATCCKPKNVEEVIKDLLAEPAAPVTVEIRFDGHGIAKHFWVACAKGVERLVTQWGATLKKNGTERIFEVTGDADTVDNLATAIELSLAGADSALKKFKAGNAEWKAMPKTGTEATKTYRMLAEVLEGFIVQRGSIEMTEDGDLL